MPPDLRTSFRECFRALRLRPRCTAEDREAVPACPGKSGGPVAALALLILFSCIMLESVSMYCKSLAVFSSMPVIFLLLGGCALGFLAFRLRGRKHRDEKE